MKIIKTYASELLASTGEDEVKVVANSNQVNVIHV